VNPGFSYPHTILEKIMTKSPYLPLFELTRGNTVESIHNGAIAVVDVQGNLVASFGDPGAVTFLRSSAKPFQALPFFEHNGPAIFNLTSQEKALICASHSGTDEHVAVVRSIQKKAGVDESELLCGVHEPYHKPTAERMHDQKEPLTPNRHNCSGKHTGMLAYVKLKQRSGEQLPEGLEYIDRSHPIQKEILSVFAEMCDLPVDQVQIGIDGCSAPNFAVPLRNAALAFARLCDPEGGDVRPPARAAACRVITSAMLASPEMVGGPGRFDTALMQTTRGRIVSKAGAEAYQGMGLLPGALSPGSPALGIALKIGDGDDRNRVRTAVALEVLRQLGALSPAELELLADFGPTYNLYNWRKVPVGQAYPTFQLVHHG
jgi:L-asparaginase II